MKIAKRVLTVAFASVFVLSLCACGEGTPIPNPTPPAEAQTYTIQYADEEGIHTFEVTQGKLYSISPVPEKIGYEFLGLYDAEVGGTQYVNSKGSGLSAFTDGEDKILYPQFKAKEYTLVLDYQGAAVTGSRSLKVEYDSEIRELPMNVALENKEFMGWYTEPNRKGNQIADQYGVLPEKKKVTEKQFDLSDTDDIIKLYAGFKATEYTVTFYAFENSAPEEVKVEYGTPISEVRTDTRVDGKAVLSWSKKKNDVNGEQIFSGKVMNDMVLYAAELAPFIEFNSNGGEEIDSLIARAGEDISLPVTKRDGYVFVGWFMPNGNKFEQDTMPAMGEKLKAGYYKKVEIKKQILGSDEEVRHYDGGQGDINSDLTINLSDFLASDFSGEITLDVQFELKHTFKRIEDDRELWFAIDYYSKPTTSDSKSHLGYNSVTFTKSDYIAVSWHLSCKLTGNIIYSRMHATGTNSADYYSVKNYSVKISFVDTSKLY